MLLNNLDPLPPYYGRLPLAAGLLVCLLLFGLAACSEDGTRAEPVDEIVDGSGDQHSEPDQAASDLGDDQDLAESPDLTTDPQPDSSIHPICQPCQGVGECLRRLRGRVLLEDGAPIADVKLQMCLYLAESGISRCLRPVDSRADGTFDVLISDDLTCLESAAVRVVLPGADLTTLYCPIDLAQGPEVELPQPLVLHTTYRASNLDPTADAQQSRPVLFEAGLTLEITPADMYVGQEGYETLASRHFSGHQLPDLCFLGEPPRLDEIWGFSPESEIDSAFSLRIPNRQELASGEAVDLWLLGGLHTVTADGARIHEAQWVPYGTATVSEDGLFLVSHQEDGGLPHLTWFGFSAQD